MKLTHLAVAIVFVIAFVVAAIITAFALVTFSSLDKAVQSSMASEIDYVSTSVRGLIDRTVRPGLTLQKVLLANNWTSRYLPVLPPGSSHVGQNLGPYVQNWTGAFDIMSSTMRANLDLFFYVYETFYDEGAQTCGGVGFAAAPDTGPDHIIIVIPNLMGNMTYINASNSPPWNNLEVLVERPYNCHGSEWHLNLAEQTRDNMFTGRFSAADIYSSPRNGETNALITFGLPLEFNETSGYATSGINIDMDAGLISKALREVATKGNKIFIIDARNTRDYDGCIVTSSLSTKELPPFDEITRLPFFPTRTPNSEVNGLMSRVFEEYPGGFEGLKTSTTDVVIDDYEGYVVVAAHIYAPGNFHWVVVSAVPRDYYYGSTAATIAGTIGGGAGLLVVACVLIVYIMLEQQKLVDGSRQSAEIAQSVANNLVLYDTAAAAVVIKKALQPTLSVVAGVTIDEDGDEVEEYREETNYASRRLVLALKQINQNLTAYKPHLPEYVLPSNIMRSQEKREEDEEDEDENGEYGDTTGTDGDENKDNNNNRKKKLADKGSSKNSGNKSQSTEEASGTSGGGSSDGKKKKNKKANQNQSGQRHQLMKRSNNTYYVDVGGQKRSENNNTNRKNNNNNNASPTASKYANNNNKQQFEDPNESTGDSDDFIAGGTARVGNNNLLNADQQTNMTENTSDGTDRNDTATTLPIAKLALLRHSGDTVERVVMANLNLSRAHEVLFPAATSATSLQSQLFTVRNVNRIIENILETAHATDATVHSVIGDNITATWNATSRVVNPDLKAMRFVTAVDSHLKRELHELYMGNNGTESAASQQTFSPFLDPNRFVLTGGVVNGSAWCQLGGSSKRQQFTLLNFSEASCFASTMELGTRLKFVAVCRTISQNCQNEFLFRGAGIHVLPGSESILFPRQKNTSRASSRQHSRRGSMLMTSAGKQQQLQEQLPHQTSATIVKEGGMINVVENDPEKEFEAAVTSSNLNFDTNTAQPAAFMNSQLATANSSTTLHPSEFGGVNGDSTSVVASPPSNPVAAPSTASAGGPNPVPLTPGSPTPHRVTAKSQSVVLALPIYELCGRRKGIDPDEDEEEDWLYMPVLSKTNTMEGKNVVDPAVKRQKEQQNRNELAAMFDELAIEISRGAPAAANVVLERIAAFDNRAVNLPCHKNLKSILRRM